MEQEVSTTEGRQEHATEMAEWAVNHAVARELDVITDELTLRNPVLYSDSVTEKSNSEAKYHNILRNDDKLSVYLRGVTEGVAGTRGATNAAKKKFKSPGSKLRARRSAESGLLKVSRGYSERASKELEAIDERINRITTYEDESVVEKNEVLPTQSEKNFDIESILRRSAVAFDSVHSGIRVFEMRFEEVLDNQLEGKDELDDQEFMANLLRLARGNTILRITEWDRMSAGLTDRFNNIRSGSRAATVGAVEHANTVDQISR